MELAYAVVRFNEDGTYSEIPNVWISPSKTSCFWPKGRNVSSLISRKVFPDKTWKKYDIEVIGYYDSIEAARKKAVNSDCSTEEEERGRGYRPKKPSRRILSFSDDDTSDTDSKESSPPPILISTNKKTTEKGGTSQQAASFSVNLPAASNTQKVSISPSVTPSGSKNRAGCISYGCTPQPCAVNSDPSASNGQNLSLFMPSGGINGDSSVNYECGISGERTDETLKEPISRLVMNLTEKVDSLMLISRKTLMYVKGIEERMQQKELGEKKVSSSILGIMEKLPIDSIDSLEHLDSKLEDECIKDSFINYMRSIGGRNAKEMVSRIMTKIIKNSLGVQCSLLGKRNHFAFKSLKLMDTIIAAVRHHFDTVTQSEIELMVGEWLRLSNLRQSREKT